MTFPFRLNLVTRRSVSRPLRIPSSTSRVLLPRSDLLPWQSRQTTTQQIWYLNVLNRQTWKLQYQLFHPRIWAHHCSSQISSRLKHLGLVMVGSPWVEVVLRLFNQIPMYQSYTLRQANLAPENLWLKEKDRQGTNYILSGTQNCDGQFPISRWFSYIAHCKTSMYRAFPIATFDLLDGNEMTHSLISWIWGRTSMASIASVMVYAMPWLQCTTGGWLTWRNLISPNYTELYNHPNKRDCPPTSSASLGLPTYPYLPDIHVYIYIYGHCYCCCWFNPHAPCLSEPKNFGEATPCSPLRSWPWLRPRTLAPPWPVRCGTLGLPWRTPNFMAKSVLSERENG